MGKTKPEPPDEDEDKADESFAFLIERQMTKDGQQLFRLSRSATPGGEMTSGWLNKRAFLMLMLSEQRVQQRWMAAGVHGAYHALTARRTPTEDAG